MCYLPSTTVLKINHNIDPAPIINNETIKCYCRQLKRWTSNEDDSELSTEKHLFYINEIEEIHFADDFNQPIDQIRWPRYINYFGEDFNQPIENINYPDTLKEIFICHNFQHSTQKISDRFDIFYL
jgi:hypothetical protein